MLHRPGLSLYEAASTAEVDGRRAGLVHADQIRYVAPTGLDYRDREITIEYYAQSPSGERTRGEVSVTVKPQPETADDNHAPRPGIEVRRRRRSGSRFKASTPSQDPDGDRAGRWHRVVAAPGKGGRFQPHLGHL